jgi:hypothetical protein
MLIEKYFVPNIILDLNHQHWTHKTWVTETGYRLNTVRMNTRRNHCKLKWTCILLKATVEPISRNLHETHQGKCSHFQVAALELKEALLELKLLTNVPFHKWKLWTYNLSVHGVSCNSRHTFVQPEHVGKGMWWNRLSATFCIELSKPWIQSFHLHWQMCWTKQESYNDYTFHNTCQLSVLWKLYTDYTKTRTHASSVWFRSSINRRRTIKTPPCLISGFILSIKLKKWKNSELK